MRAAGAAKVAVVAAAGAAWAFLFDRNRGRARRAQLRDQARSTLRRDLRAIERQASLRRGRLGGLAHRATHRNPTLPENDQVLVDKVRSEVLGRRPEVAHHVSVDAVGGVVTLRGELDDAAASSELVAAVRQVAGVIDVTDLLHRSGEPAPNKVQARPIDT